MADLKSRMHDVPGAAGMTMTMEAGQMIYNINGRSFAFDASASDASIESTIRAGLAMLPDTPTDAAPAAQAATPPDPVSAPVAAVAAPAVSAPSVAPAPAPATPAAPAASALHVKDMLAQHSADLHNLMEVQKQLLRTALDNQRLMVGNAIGGVAAKIQAQTDEFAAIMGQFTNDIAGDL